MKTRLRLVQMDFCLDRKSVWIVNTSLELSFKCRTRPILSARILPGEAISASVVIFLYDH